MTAIGGKRTLKRSVCSELLFWSEFWPTDRLQPEEAFMSYRLGVYFWGSILIIWLIAVGAAFVAPESTWSKTLGVHDSLAAALTAVLGVIWSWFLQLDSRRT